MASLAVALAACTHSTPQALTSLKASGGTVSSPATLHAGWIRHPFSAAGVSVDTPATWHAVPGDCFACGEPKPLLAAGSWQFDDASVTCFGSGLPRNGALLVLWEWTFPLEGSFPSSSVATIRRYPGRPLAFRLIGQDRKKEKRCIPRPVYDLGFQDGGRYFYFEVILGAKTSSSERAELLEVGFARYLGVNRARP